MSREGDPGGSKGEGCRNCACSHLSSCAARARSASRARARHSPQATCSCPLPRAAALPLPYPHSGYEVDIEEAAKHAAKAAATKGAIRAAAGEVGIASVRSRGLEGRGRWRAACLLRW